MYRNNLEYRRISIQQRFPREGYITFRLFLIIICKRYICIPISQFLIVYIQRSFRRSGRRNMVNKLFKSFLECFQCIFWKTEYACTSYDVLA